MAGEFSIGGSFADSLSGYNPFASLPSVGSLNPTLSTGSTPITTTTTSTSSGNSSSGWGGIFQNALNTGLNFLGGLASIDLFGRAQDAGIVNTPTHSSQTQTSQTQQSNTASNSGTSLLGLSQPMLIGGGVLLLIILLLIATRKSGK